MIAGPTKSLDLNCDQQHGESKKRHHRGDGWENCQHPIFAISSLASKIWTEHVVIELCPIVVALHAVDHILFGVRKTPGRQGVRRQCPKAGSVFVHRSHAADICAGACRGVGVDIIGGDLPFVATRIDLLEKTSNAPSSLAWWRQ